MNTENAGPAKIVPEALNCYKNLAMYLSNAGDDSGLPAASDINNERQTAGLIFFSEPCRGDVQEFAVLGNGASGEVFDTGFGQFPAYLVVAEGFGFVFGIDDLPELGPDSFPASPLAVGVFHSAAKEFS